MLLAGASRRELGSWEGVDGEMTLNVKSKSKARKALKVLAKELKYTCKDTAKYTCAKKSKYECVKRSSIEAQVCLDDNGDLFGDIPGSVHGSIEGSVDGDVYGAVEGSVYGTVHGDVNKVCRAFVRDSAQVPERSRASRRNHLTALPAPRRSSATSSPSKATLCTSEGM